MGSRSYRLGGGGMTFFEAYAEMKKEKIVKHTWEFFNSKELVKYYRIFDGIILCKDQDDEDIDWYPHELICKELDATDWEVVEV
jgi:hypothetical protein